MEAFLIKDNTTQIKHLDRVLSQKINGNILKHEVTPLTKPGENWGSEILKVDVTVEHGDKEEVIHAVAKLIPHTEMQMQLFNTQVTFKNEVGFYADIVPTLENFHREMGLPVWNHFPEFYGGRFSLNYSSEVVDKDAVLIMENLKIKGYGNLDRNIGFDLESAKTVLRTLAQTQASLLAMRKKKPDLFDAKVRPYFAEWKQPTEFSPNFDSVLGENANTIPIIPKVRKLMSRKLTKKVREPWATLTHNDLWVNNIMVKEQNGVVDHVKLVDFQVIDYRSPLSDVLFFLLTSIQFSVLKYHFDKLLRYYYNEFVQVLKSFNVNTTEFSYESFEEDVNAEGPSQASHALFMLYVLHGPKEMPKRPGKAPKWNPNGETNGHAEPEVRSSKTPEGPFFSIPQVMKEKIWFIAEEAAKRKWI